MRLTHQVSAPILIAIVLLIDRMAKVAAIAEERFDIIPGIVTFAGVQNPGVAWGVPLPAAVSIVLGILFCIAGILLSVWAWRTGRRTYVVALLSIVAGASSNLFDRVRYGAVIDYLRIGDITTNNIADLLIITGAAIVVGTIVFQKPRLSVHS